jgi:hypothetical protein
MSNETISIEIPAPPPSDERWTPCAYIAWCQEVERIARETIRAQEPRELVRFFENSGNRDGAYCMDDSGIVWWQCNETAYVSRWGYMGDELHPRLTIRSDGKGGWVALNYQQWNGKTIAVGCSYPCDRNGNPIDQEPRELVRFFDFGVDGEGLPIVDAVDDIGGRWSNHRFPYFQWYEDSTPLALSAMKELRPRLTIRSDGKGGWEAFEVFAPDFLMLGKGYPCDRNGNPLKHKPPHFDNGRFEPDMTEGRVMTPQAQRIAIAEACDWTWHGWIDGKLVMWPPAKGDACEAPDYLNDLNAMHEVMNCLDRSQLKRVQAYLLQMLPVDAPVFMATAGQLAEAFLRTIGRWEGE